MSSPDPHMPEDTFEQRRVKKELLENAMKGHNLWHKVSNVLRIIIPIVSFSIAICATAAGIWRVLPLGFAVTAMVLMQQALVEFKQMSKKRELRYRDEMLFIAELPAFRDTASSLES